MRRWPMTKAPKDGRVIIACTRVEGVEYSVTWSDGGWRDVATGAKLPDDLFAEWRRPVHDQ
jgi:hypothetical protein